MRDKARYDGHNRKPVDVPMRKLRWRRKRRRSNAYLHHLADEWLPSHDDVEPPVAQRQKGRRNG